MKIKLLIYKLLNDRKLQFELGLLLIFCACVVLAYSVSGSEILDSARMFLGGPQIPLTGEPAPAPFNAVEVAANNFISNVTRLEKQYVDTPHIQKVNV